MRFNLERSWESQKGSRLALCQLLLLSQRGLPFHVGLHACDLVAPRPVSIPLLHPRNPMPNTLINVSNRLPVTVEEGRVIRSSGGLVAALEGLPEGQYETKW